LRKEEGTWTLYRMNLKGNQPFSSSLQKSSRLRREGRDEEEEEEEGRGGFDTGK